MKNVRRPLLLTLAFAASSSAHGAQEILRSIPDLWERTQVAPTYGPFEWIGDVDGDEVEDLLVGYSTVSLGGLARNGRVRLHSGADMSVLRTHVGTASDQRLGFDVASFGDLDGDKVPDYLASRRPPGPFSFLWSGADGSVLRRIEAFDSTAPLGDHDGDGIPSFVTSFGTFGGPGSVLVYEGMEVRYGLSTPPDVVNFGLALEGLGDLDGDGWTDFAAAAPGEDFKGICERGTVFVYSGHEGRLLYRIEGPANEASLFGRYLASPGDLTGDGFQDLAIAAPRLGRDCVFGGGDGQITFHDGRNGALLDTILPEHLPVDHRLGLDTFLGGALVTAGDLNGNGFADVVFFFKADWTNPSRSKLLFAAIDGGTRELIYIVPDHRGEICQGTTEIVPTGDVNGDGFPDFSRGMSCSTPDSRLDIISGAPLGVKALGEPCKALGAPEPRIGVSGVPLVGSNFRLYLSQVAPGQDAVLVMGSSATHWGRLPLPIRLPGSRCNLWVSPDQRIPARASRIRPGEGAAEVALPIPDDPALVGTTFYAQWLLRSSRALRNAGGSTGSISAFPLHERTSTRALAITIRAEVIEIPPAGLTADGAAMATGNATGPLAMPSAVAPSSGEFPSSEVPEEPRWRGRGWTLLRGE